MDVTQQRRSGPSKLARDVSNVEIARSTIANDDVRHSDEKCLLILDARTLDRECLAKALLNHRTGMRVLAVGSVDEWREMEEAQPPLAAVLLSLGGHDVTEAGVVEEIARLTSHFRQVPLVILADSEDLEQILKALECGARGYIPSSVGIDLCAEAISLAVAGGIFVPAAALLSMRRGVVAHGDRSSLSGMFTPRQAEVVMALRRGKANKIIARELNLRESTVKVHIHNIMKKLDATNRTEAAFRINDLFPAESGHHASAG